MLSDSFCGSFSHLNNPFESSLLRIYELNRLNLIAYKAIMLARLKKFILEAKFMMLLRIGVCC